MGVGALTFNVHKSQCPFNVHKPQCPFNVHKPQCPFNVHKSGWRGSSGCMHGRAAASRLLLTRATKLLGLIGRQAVLGYLPVAYAWPPVAYAGQYASLTIRMCIQAHTLVRIQAQTLMRIQAQTLMRILIVSDAYGPAYGTLPAWLHVLVYLFGVRVRGAGHAFLNPCHACVPEPLYPYLHAMHECVQEPLNPCHACLQDPLNPCHACMCVGAPESMSCMFAGSPESMSCMHACRSP